MQRQDRRRRRARRRLTPGDGRALRPFRWWQGLSRALFHLPVGDDPDGPERTYSVDVPHWQRLVTEEGHGKAHLYLDGRRQASSELPAVFPVEGGVVEVVPSLFGLRRCHHVPSQGPERPLVPDPRSAEGARARLHHRHRVLSHLLALTSLLLVLAAAALAVPQLVEVITRIPPVTERVGVFDAPVELSVAQNILIAVVAAAASTERATRLRYSWLDALAQE